VKKDGTKWCKNQPYLRTEVIYNKKIKLDKLLNCLYNHEHIKKWDTNVKTSK